MDQGTRKMFQMFGNCDFQLWLGETLGRLGNMDNEKMFVCFYGDKEKIEVFATSSYGAQKKAIAIFKAPKSKSHLVSVMLITEYVKENFRYN